MMCLEVMGLFLKTDLFVEKHLKKTSITYCIYQDKYGIMFNYQKNEDVGCLRGFYSFRRQWLKKVKCRKVYA